MYGHRECHVIAAKEGLTERRQKRLAVLVKSGVLRGEIGGDSELWEEVKKYPSSDVLSLAGCHGKEYGPADELVCRYYLLQIYLYQCVFSDMHHH